MCKRHNRHRVSPEVTVVRNTAQLTLSGLLCLACVSCILQCHSFLYRPSCQQSIFGNVFSMYVFTGQCLFQLVIMISRAGLLRRASFPR